MGNWEAAEEMRLEREEERQESDVHVRADLGAATFPCGRSATETVFVGDDGEVTCRDCLHALRMRALRSAQLGPADGAVDPTDDDDADVLGGLVEQREVAS